VSGPPVTSADDWDAHWDAFSSANERNPAQDYRRRVAMRLLEADGVPLRLLDIGSGQGNLLVAARRRWPRAELAGLEGSKRGAAATEALLPGVAVEVRDLLADGGPSQALSRWATHALCSEVLEHVDDPVLLMRNASDYLAPACRVVVTVPGGRVSAFDRHIGHRRHFTPQSLREVLTDAGLTVEWTSGAGFPFFNLYRALVVARGQRLVDDAAGGPGGEPRRPLRLAMAAFQPLFRLNLERTRLGTQIIGVARA
jgi:trans-aconitate methyltransferase